MFLEQLTHSLLESRWAKKTLFSKYWVCCFWSQRCRQKSKWHCCWPIPIIACSIPSCCSEVWGFKRSAFLLTSSLCFSFYPFGNQTLKIKRSTTRHIIIKLSKTKTKMILKAAREKWLATYEGSSLRLREDFSSETWRPEGNGTVYSKC